MQFVPEEGDKEGDRVCATPGEVDEEGDTVAGALIPHAGAGEPFAWWMRPAANGVRPVGFTPSMAWRTVPAEPLAERSMPLVADRELVFLGVHLGDPWRRLEKLRAV